MATGSNSDPPGHVYSSLQEDKDPHQYQRLVGNKNTHGRTLPPSTDPVGDQHGQTELKNVPYGSKVPLYAALFESQPSYVTLHSTSSESFGQPGTRVDYYHKSALTPLGPPKTDDYYEAASVTNPTKHGAVDGTGRYEKEKPVFQQGYSANSPYYNDYSKPIYPEAVKYTNHPGVEHVDWVDSSNLQHENNTYEEIPADEGRPSSRGSLRSVSSVEPILPVASEKGPSLFRKPGKRVICLVGLIIMMLVIITVIVAIAVALSNKGNQSEGDSNSQRKATTKIETGSTTSQPTVGPSWIVTGDIGNSNGPTKGTTQTETSPTTGKPTVYSGSSPNGRVTGETSSEPGITNSHSPTMSPGTTGTTISTTVKPPLIPDHTYFISTLVVVDHPRDKVRLQGDSVTICCLATGTPSPVFYDWYKDGVFLADHTQYTNLSSSLHLTDLTTSDTGFYSCKASNTQSMVISDSAWLDVRQTESFCPATPEAYIIALPTECTYNGDTVYNQGLCPTVPCRGLTSNNGHCVDPVQHCCGPVSYQTLLIMCHEHEYKVSKVSQCGCVPCDKSVNSIVGIAQTLDGLTRFSYGHIYLRNMSTDVNDRFGTSGIFELELENNAHRLVVLTDNVYDHDTFYNHSSHVIHLPNTLAGSHYLSADVRYLRKDTGNISASQDIHKEFTLKNGSPFLELTMENSHYYTHDKNPYSGNVDVSINFISGDDMDSLLAVAGDFMFISGDGKARHLMAYGLFVIELVGSDSPVYYQNTIDVNVYAGHLTNISETRLWRLGESGYWHVEDYLQISEDKGSNQEYTAKIHHLQYATTWFAIARASEWETCFTKVRLFEGSSNHAGSQLTGATVKITVAHEDGSGMVAGTRAVSDTNDLNGYCIAHPCDTTESFSLYATASYEGHMLDGTNTENSVENTITIIKGGIINSNGATYMNSESCSVANMTTDKYIAFRRQTCEVDISAVRQPLSFNTSECIPQMYLTWHSAHEQEMNSYKSCHIKILAQNLTGTTFQAISISTASSTNLESGSYYGVREDCVNSKGVVCLQIKPGGTVNCNNMAVNAITDVSNITVFSIGNIANVSEVDASLTRKFAVGSSLRDKVFQFSFPGDPYGIYYGIFCANDASPEAARWRSKRYCLSGKERDSEIGLNDITTNRYAVKFEQSASRR